jgi:hypothetical protein
MKLPNQDGEKIQYEEIFINMLLGIHSIKYSCHNSLPAVYMHEA